eukprot:TRINITY_DN30191_c0_g1_i1.p1 TRINITY_DN30191_c0_g1~~TRINITY_DN30191_c0_g1_i1.p1  ORF type:complete len:289 (+),score=33.64 TRINITY_DN30191_c0_g1_i1:40-906(+)
MVGAHLTSRIKSFVSSIARRRTTRDQVEAFSSVCAGDKAIESSTNDVGPNRKCCSSRSCAYLVSEHDAHESHFDSWHESHNKHLHERLAQTSSHRTAHVPLEPECFSRTAPVRPTKAECVHDGIVDDDCKQSSSPFSRSGSSEELGAKFDTLMNTAALQSCAGALIPAAHAEWSRTASKASAGESSFGDGRWSSSYDSDDEFAVLDPHVPSQRTVTIHNLPEPEAFMSSKRLRVVLQSFNRPTSEEPIIEEHASDESGETLHVRIDTRSSFGTPLCPTSISLGRGLVV